MRFYPGFLISLSLAVAGLETLFHIMTWRLFSNLVERALLLLLTALLYLLLLSIANLFLFLILKLGETILSKRMNSKFFIHLFLSFFIVLSIPIGTYFRFDLHSQAGWNARVIAGFGFIIILSLMVSALLSLLTTTVWNRVRFGGAATILFLCILFLLSSIISFIYEPNEDIRVQTEKYDIRGIILIVIDTLRSDYINIHGREEIETPNIDRFAREGVYFKNVVSQIPVTGPSHLSIFTSSYPFRLGICGNGIPIGRPEGYLPLLLKEKGFWTAAFVSGFPLHSKFGFSRGFDIYDDDFGGIKGLQKVFPMVLIEYLTMPGNFLRERKAERTNLRLFQVLDRIGDEPFFIFLHYYDPHAPYEPPSPYDTLYWNKDESPSREGERFELHGYWPKRLRGITDKKFFISQYKGEITYVDTMIGKVRDYLEKRGMLDETLIIITSDHGESLGEHEYYFDHGLELYDPSLIVPLIFRAPRILPKGRVIERQIDLLDITPTIYDMVKIEPNHTVSGKSLMRLIEEEGYNIEEIPMSFSVTLTTREKETRDLDYSLRTPARKYIDKFDEEDEFYDLLKDPKEEFDLLERIERKGEEKDELAMYRDEIFYFRGILQNMRENENILKGEMDRHTIEKLKALGYIE